MATTAAPQPQASQLGPIESLVSSFLAVVAAPFLVGGPASPAGPLGSVLELIWVATRRLQSFFFDSNPTAQPVQIAQVDAGTVTGIVGGLDPDGDPLRYNVTRGPANGTVEIDDQGNYTYTPSAALAETGGTDTFEVRVRDTTDFTLNNIISALMGRSTAATTTVVVAVAAPGSAATIGVGDTPQGVTLSADGTRAYVTNSADRSISVVDTATNEVIATIADVGNSPTGPVATADGKLYVANQSDDNVAVIDTETNAVISTIGVGGGPQAIALAAGKAYVVNSQDNTVSVIDTTTNQVTATIRVGETPHSVAVSPDGTRVYVTDSAGSQGGTVSVIDTATDTRVGAIRVGAAPRGLAVSPDGTKVYVTDFATGSLSVIDADTNEVTVTLRVGGYPDAVAVSPDGTKVFVTNSQDGTVSVIDTATNVTFGTISVGDTAPALAVSADGTKLYIPNLQAGTLSVVAINPAAAPPPGTPRAPAAGWSDGEVGSRVQVYTVYNLTEHDVYFLGYNDPATDRPLEGPTQGTMIPPGGYTTFTLGPGNWRIEAVFGYGDIPHGANGQVPDLSGLQGEYALFVAKFTHITFNTNTSEDWTRCHGAGGVGSCAGIGKHSAVLLPPPDSDVTIGADNPTLQSAILNTVCHDNSSCLFWATSHTTTTLAPRIVGNPTHNLTESNIHMDYIASVDTSYSMSISVTASVGATIANMVNASFSTTFSQQWTKAHKYTDEVHYIIPPGQWGWVTAATPTLRLYGDFDVRYNGVNFKVKDVYFDAPDPHRRAYWTPVQSSTPPPETAT